MHVKRRRRAKQNRKVYFTKNSPTLMPYQQPAMARSDRTWMGPVPELGVGPI